METRISALLMFLQDIKWGKFVVVSDNDYESVSFVSSLQDHLPPRNMEMIDWLVFNVDDSSEDMFLRFRNLKKDVVTFILVTNNLTMAFHTFDGAGGIEGQAWVIVSDLHANAFRYSRFPPNVYSLTPRTKRENTLSAFVIDTVSSIGRALAKRPEANNGTCPRMREMRR